jgi:RNase P/RNase MRP subunit p30
MFDLNVKWKAAKPKENTELVKQLLKLGWSTSAWTTSNFGKLGAKSQKLSNTLCLDATDVRDCLKYRGVVSKDELAEVRQLSRITVTIDEVVDAQALTAGNETLKAFDIVAACPGNAAVFAYLCKTAQVDIISIDFRRKVSFPMIKKQVAHLQA